MMLYSLFLRRVEKQRLKRQLIAPDSIITLFDRRQLSPGKMQAVVALNVPFIRKIEGMHHNLNQPVILLPVAPGLMRN
jgi:hypothetical protein